MPDINKTAVIVLNYFGHKDTSACIKSVQENLDAHIFLVDNSADNEERARLEDTFSSNSTITLFFPSENLGFAAGVNFALRQAIEAGFERFYITKQ